MGVSAISFFEIEAFLRLHNMDLEDPLEVQDFIRFIRVLDNEFIEHHIKKLEEQRESG